MLDVFVKVPSSVATPVEYKPMEVDATNRVTDGREQGKRATFDLSMPTFLVTGGVSVKDSETASPQRDEHSGCQVECDSALGVKSDGHDIELNGETDNEDVEDEETRFDGGSAQVRNIRDPGQPTANEYKEHVATPRPYRSWCEFCVMARGVNSPHRRSDAQEDLEGVAPCVGGLRFFGERESEEQVPPMLVIRERTHKVTWAMLVPRKGT